MKALRRILGIIVMIAGILGILLSGAGIAAVWIFKPQIVTTLESTITTLQTSVDTSKMAMQTTADALGATVQSVDALQVMLTATASSVENTQPVVAQVTDFMGEKLPATITAATDSLKSAQQSAQVLDGAIKSLESFQRTMGPALAVFGVTPPTTQYNPDTPLAESLGEVAKNLESLPDMFTEMSASMDKSDDNLGTIQTSLTTMATSVTTISDSLTDYKNMAIQSKSSMDNLKSMLDNLKLNLNNILNTSAIAITLFFLWLLIAQIVILTQGLELYRGTTDRME